MKYHESVAIANDELRKELSLSYEIKNYFVYSSRNNKKFAVHKKLVLEIALLGGTVVDVCVYSVLPRVYLEMNNKVYYIYCRTKKRKSMEYIDPVENS